MSNLLTQILLGLVAVGFFSDLVKGFFQRKKVKSSADLDEANATQVIVTSTKALLGPLTERLETAERKVRDLTIDLAKAQEQVDEIVESLEKCGRENSRLLRENKRLRLRLNPEAGK